MTTLVRTKVICTGSKACGVTECEHYHEHEWTPACEGSCFGGGVCVEVKKVSSAFNPVNRLRDNKEPERRLRWIDVFTAVLQEI